MGAPEVTLYQFPRSRREGGRVHEEPSIERPARPVQEVLQIDLAWMDEIVRAKRARSACLSS
jgi:hypothetical protein